MSKEKLAKLREQIDVLDKDLITLFQQRMKVSEEIGAVKAGANMPLTDEAREQKVIDAAVSFAGGDSKRDVTAFMRSLISLSKLRQRDKLMPDFLFPPPSARKPTDIKATYQGVRGAWGEQGAMRLFPDASLAGLEYFEDVFKAVKAGEADYGVVPIENSQTGAIGEVYGLLRCHGCYIVGQTWIPIRQCLLVKPGTTPGDIREVLSHPQGFGQCRGYLKNKGWTLTACRNTAVAAQTVSESDGNRFAAIGSRQAAEIYGLEVLAPDIDDKSGNSTRFIAIAANPIYNEESDTISVTFSTLNISGALCAVLQSFMLESINLTRIESRPVSADKYRFFADIQANILDERTIGALKSAAVQCEYFEVLGCYKSDGTV